MSAPSSGGPAFPRVPVQWGNGQAVWGQSGMSLRDYFAGQELAKKNAAEVCDTPEAYARLAAHCYRMADAMLNARKQQGSRAERLAEEAEALEQEAGR